MTILSIVSRIFSNVAPKVALIGLIGILSGCQLQNGANTNSSLRLASANHGIVVPGTTQTPAEADGLQFASILKATVPGLRPYNRQLYSGDLELDIVPNPDIDSITGRDISNMPLSERRRLSSLPFSKRAVLYNPIIRRYARANGIDFEFARAVIYSESSFKVNAKGRAGEIGLMQVKPRTARSMGYRGTNNQLYIPENNIKYGMKYLRRAKDKGDGSICGTILKYNAGLYAKRMNPISARYCRKVKRLMRQSRGLATG